MNDITSPFRDVKHEIQISIIRINKLGQKTGNPKQIDLFDLCERCTKVFAEVVESQFANPLVVKEN